ncbi:hypothetical protein [Brevibacillus brevis]|uniref:hypothetical protein n=1 Tax=Brevibacillus brevis TaxID=1393 RepID=UPI0009EEE76B|nr:hypothetical protein [Brevibacillus brevis]
MKNTYRIIGDTVEILLRSKKYGNFLTNISLGDLEKVNQFKGSWYLWHREGDGYYVKGNINVNNKKTTIFLHRYIFDLPSVEIHIDHIDHNGLNNTRGNLREVNHFENSQNRTGAYSTSKSGQRGVAYSKLHDKYESYININYIKYSLGLFKTVEEASEMASIARAVFMTHATDDQNICIYYKEDKGSKLIFRHGVMGSGKTDNLLKLSHIYKRLKKNICLLTPHIDNRFGDGLIKSRSGWESKAEIIYPDTDVSSIITKSGSEVIFIDEVNFLTMNQIKQISYLLEFKKLKIYCYGLLKDFKNDFFASSLELLRCADQIQEIKSNCSYCENVASRILKIKNGTPVYKGDQVEIGAEDLYRSVCISHYHNPPSKDVG